MFVGRISNYATSSHGVAADGSPRREPWEMNVIPLRAAERRKNPGHIIFSDPAALTHEIADARLTPWPILGTNGCDLN